MGKYIRKAKIKDDPTVMDAVPHPQNSLGVRTRAKTLALQKLQSAKPPLPPNDESRSYLQLRSRRLEKVLPLINEPKNKPPTTRPNRRENPSPAKSGSVGSVPIECSKNQEVGVPEFSGKEDKVEDQNDLNIEPSLGENSPDFDGRERRSTRESTPCSLMIKESDIIDVTPGSTTKLTASAATNRRMQNSLRDIPITTHEFEDFFGFAEEHQRRLFIEKYNFDVVNDLPLPGRYEWVKVNN